MRVLALLLVWEILVSHAVVLGAAPKSIDNLGLPAFILAKTACYGRVVPQFEAHNENDFSRGNPKPFIQPAHAQVAVYHHELCLEKVGVAKTGEMWMRRSIEAVQLKNGHAFVADTMGWDAMGTRYTFVLPGDTHPFTDRTYWQNKTMDLLQEIGDLTQNRAEKAMIQDGVQYIQEQLRLRPRPPLMARFSAAAPVSVAKEMMESGPQPLAPDSAVKIFWSDRGELPTGGRWFQLVLAGASM